MFVRFTYSLGRMYEEPLTFEAISWSLVHPTVRILLVSVAASGFLGLLLCRPQLLQIKLKTLASLTEVHNVIKGFLTQQHLYGNPSSAYKYY